MPVSTPKYKNLFCQTLKKQVLIRGFLLYHFKFPWKRHNFVECTINKKITQPSRTIREYNVGTHDFENSQIALA